MASIAWNSITFSLSKQEFMPSPSSRAKIEMLRPSTPFWEAAGQSLLFKWLDNNYGVYVFIFLMLLDWCSISLGLALSLWNRITHSTMKNVFFFNMLIYLLAVNPQWIQTKALEIQVLLNSHKAILLVTPP